MSRTRTIRYLRVAACVVFFLFSSEQASSQYINSKEIEPLIREWNFANNARSVESFNNVYSGKLLFYTESVSRSTAINLKQKFFLRNQEFAQRIITGITYTPYTTGVIKCDFTKEVLQGDSTWRQYPSYLLVSYENKRYWVVGESDYVTDRRLKYRLDLGEPMELEQLENGLDTVEANASFAAGDSLAVAPDTLHNLNSQSPSTVDSTRSNDEINDAAKTNAALEPETITIPKSYVFYFIGFLLLVGISIFAANRIRRKRKNQMPLNKALESENSIQDFHAQFDFEQFVITLFDPLYFRYKRMKDVKVLAGKDFEGETAADFQLEFNHKQTRTQFAIKCIYLNEVSDHVSIFSDGDLKRFRHFEEETELDLYCILGVGGVPDDPKELFLIPAKVMQSESVTKGNLERYRKYGMFFYNDVMKTIR